MEEADRQLVYGLHERLGSFCLLEHAEAVRLVRDFEAIQMCSTVGQLRAVATQITDAWVPDLEDLDEAEAPDDQPWDWLDCGAAQEGDWPPLPTAYALDLDEAIVDALIELAGAREISTMLNGDYLRLPPEKEAEMVSALTTLGLVATRDDDLIRGLGT